MPLKNKTEFFILTIISLFISISCGGSHFSSSSTLATQPNTSISISFTGAIRKNVNCEMTVQADSFADIIYTQFDVIFDTSYFRFYNLPVLETSTQQFILVLSDNKSLTEINNTGIAKCSLGSATSELNGNSLKLLRLYLTPQKSGSSAISINNSILTNKVETNTNLTNYSLNITVID